MAYFTNLYAVQHMTPYWKPTNGNELGILFGLHISMGYLKISQFRLYWNRDLEITLFIENMSRRKFYSCVRKRCGEHAVEIILSVDEQIIPF